MRPQSSAECAATSCRSAHHYRAAAPPASVPRLYPLVRRAGLQGFLSARAAAEVMAGGRGGAARLEGVLCRGVGEAEEAAAVGAHSLALRMPVAPAGLAALCERVSVPVFVRGLALKSAWAQGASGINALVDS